MGKGKQTFKQTDLTRAIKSALAAGLNVTRIIVDRDGQLTIVTEPVIEKRVAAGSGWEDA